MKELLSIPNFFWSELSISGHLQAEVVTSFCRQAAVVAHKQYTVVAGTGINANSCEKEKGNI